MPVFRSTARSAMMIRPFCGKRGAVGEDQLQIAGALHLALGPHPLIRQVLALADADVDSHRIDVGDRREQRGLTLSNEIAGSDLAYSGDPVDWRRDAAVLDVELGLLNTRLRGFDCSLRLLRSMQSG